MVKDRCKVCGRETECVVFPLFDGDDVRFGLTDTESTDIVVTVEICLDCITDCSDR